MTDYVEYRGAFYRLLHPRPTVLIASTCPNGRVNVMPASWVTPVSEDPPTVGVSVDNSSYTRECLDHSGEATINVPGYSQMDLVYGLGTVSGRDVDKVSRFGLRLVPSTAIGTPGIEGSLAMLETRVLQKVTVGEVTFYLLEVRKTRVLEGFANEYGYNLARESPLLHGWGRVFHRVEPRKGWARKP